MYALAQIDDDLSLIEKQTASQVFQAYVKQQDQYNEILAASANKETEKELRIKNR
jgi:hypothetical protein